MRTGQTGSELYEIRVQARLEPRWESWFDGFTVAAEPDGITVISGTVVDQAALHGLLQSLRDLNLPLVSVTQPQDDATESAASRQLTAETTEPPPVVPAQHERA